MKKKIWIKYFSYAFIIFALMYSVQYLSIFLNNLMEKTYNPNFYLSNSISFMICAIIGVFIGLECFLKEKIKDGRWKINLPKLTLLGLPSLYFSLYAFIYYSPITFVRNIISKPLNFFLQGNMPFIAIFHLIFGYVLITSLYKVNQE